MRKILIKYFALSYSFKTNNKTWSLLRAAVPISILMSVSIILGMLRYSDILTSSLLMISVNILLLISLFIGFIYFKLNSTKPIEYEELDGVQKLTFSKLPNYKLQKYQQIEVKKLEQKGGYNNKYVVLSLFFIPILSVIITGFILFI